MKDSQPEAIDSIINRKSSIINAAATVATPVTYHLSLFVVDNPSSIMHNQRVGPQPPREDREAMQKAVLRLRVPRKMYLTRMVAPQPVDRAGRPHFGPRHAAWRDPSEPEEAPFVLDTSKSPCET